MRKDRLYAGELRAMGIPIDDSVPDCAHVAREACIFSIGDTNIEGDKIVMDYTITFTEPFKWVSVNVTIDAGQQ
jgi:hypothetical protein